MKQSIEKIIERLQTQVKENLYQIDQNQMKIKKIFDQQNSPEQKEIIDLLFFEIKTLLSANNDCIQQQLSLISFFEKNRENPEPYNDDEPSLDLSSELPNEENLIFDMTIQGELPFDQYHPMFMDEQFFEKLIHYYTSIEEYEICSELMKTRDLSSIQKLYP